MNFWYELRQLRAKNRLSESISALHYQFRYNESEIKKLLRQCAIDGKDYGFCYLSLGDAADSIDENDYEELASRVKAALKSLTSGWPPYTVLIEQDDKGTPVARVGFDWGDEALKRFQDE